MINTLANSFTLRPSKSTLAFFALLLMGLIALYSQGFDNKLFFDDARLSDGTIFGNYGHVFPLKVRLLSYGSFVWVQDLFGEGWWKQRAFNVAVHLCTSVSIYAFIRLLIDRTEFSEDFSKSQQCEATKDAALRLSVGLFALNPVAVYAVAYLIQRSTLMATFWAIFACWAFVAGLVSQRKRWFGVAAVAYLCAVLSKEAAILSIALTVPLYVFVCRPPMKKTVLLVGVSLGVLAAITAVLLNTSFYANVVGQLTDEVSQAYAVQLEKISPGIRSSLYPLSLLNQATQFFQYGFLWLFPNPASLSVDLRPEFPLSFFSWPHSLGALCYLLSIFGASWLVLRRSDALGLMALAVLCATLLFVTEFATVWIQDPLVLYRSYLWGAMLPLLLIVPMLWFTPSKLYVIGGAVLCLFAFISLDRINSLQDARSAWSDATSKVNLAANPNAVGRWRAFLNLGTEEMDRDNFTRAHKAFSQADALGEPFGSARFNMGVTLQLSKNHLGALAEFAKAQSMGFDEAALYQQRAESFFALGRFSEALESYGVALGRPQQIQGENYTRLRHAEAAMATDRLPEAQRDYEILLDKEPENIRYKVGLAMVFIGKRDLRAALDLLNPVIAKNPTAQAYYARALAYYFARDTTSSASDLAVAMQVEPSNPVYKNLQALLSAKPALR